MATTVSFPEVELILPMEGQEDRVFPDALPQRFMNHEAIAVERALGMTFDKFVDGINEGSAACLTGWIWTLMKREDPKVRYGDVTFRILGYSLRAPGQEDAVDGEGVDGFEETAAEEVDAPAPADPTELDRESLESAAA